MKSLFFSIIIPAYNEEKLLPRCLESVFAQDFPNNDYEVIVVDNNSIDLTREIAQKFGVNAIEEKRQGLVFSRNAGLQAAIGKYFINLDADCKVPSDWLSRIEKSIRENKNVGLLTGPYNCVDEKQEKDWINFFIAIFMSLMCRIFGTPIGYYGGNVVIERKSFLKIGGYELKYSTDQISIIGRLRKIGKKILFDKNLIVLCSPRRTKGRLIKFVFKDMIYMYLINNLYARITGKNLGNWENIR